MAPACVLRVTWGRGLDNDFGGICMLCSQKQQQANDADSDQSASSRAIHERFLDLCDLVSG